MSDGTVLLIITKSDRYYLETREGQILTMEILRINDKLGVNPDISNDWIISRDNKQFVYLDGFKEFLEGRMWIEFFKMANLM